MTNSAGTKGRQGHCPPNRGKSSLSLCWAVLDLVISHANGVTFTDLDRQAIDRHTHQRAERSTAEEVIAA